MEITYKAFNGNADIVAKLAKIEIKSFETKIKLLRVNKWFEAENEILKVLVTEIENKYKLKETFDFNDEGIFVGENRDELVKVLEAKHIDEEELLAQTLQGSEYIFTAEDLEPLETSTEDLIKLESLGLFKLD